MPSRRNSGFDATPTSLAGAGLGSSCRATSRVEPTGIVDLLTTTAPGAEHRGDLAATASTAERSAAPVADCGVGTQRNTNSACAAAVAAPTTKRSRPAARPSATSAGRPSSRIGTSPFERARDAFLVEVGAGDRVPEVRQARGGGEPHVPRPDDRDVTHVPLRSICVPVLHVVGDRVAPRAQRGQAGEAQGAVVERAHRRPGRGPVEVGGSSGATPIGSSAAGAQRGDDQLVAGDRLRCRW